MYIVVMLISMNAIGLSLVEELTVLWMWRAVKNTVKKSSTKRVGNKHHHNYNSKKDYSTINKMTEEGQKNIIENVIKENNSTNKDSVEFDKYVKKVEKVVERTTEHPLITEVGETVRNKEGNLVTELSMTNLTRSNNGFKVLDKKINVKKLSKARGEEQHFLTGFTFKGKVDSVKLQGGEIFEEFKFNREITEERLKEICNESVESINTDKSRQQLDVISGEWIKNKQNFSEFETLKEFNDGIKGIIKNTKDSL